MKAIGVGLILHQITALFFLNVEEIFPEKEIRLFSKLGKTMIYLIMAVIILVVLMNIKRIASIICRRDTKNEQCIIP